MLTIILQYGFKETLVVYKYSNLYVFFFSYSFTIAIHLPSYNFSIYRVKDMIMNIISWMEYKNI